MSTTAAIPPVHKTGSEPAKKTTSPAAPTLPDVLADIAGRCGYNFGASAALLGPAGRGDLQVAEQATGIVCSATIRSAGSLPAEPVKQALLALLRAKVKESSPAAVPLDAHAERLRDARAAANLARQDLGDAGRAAQAIRALDRALADLAPVPAEGAISIPSPDALRQEQQRLSTARTALAAARQAIQAAQARRQRTDVLAPGAGDLLVELNQVEADAKKRLSAAEELVRQLEPRVRHLAEQFRAQAAQAVSGLVTALAAQVQEERARVVREVVAALSGHLALLATLESAAGTLMDHRSLSEALVVELMP